MAKKQTTMKSRDTEPPPKRRRGVSRDLYDGIQSLINGDAKWLDLGGAAQSAKTRHYLRSRPYQVAEELGVKVGTYITDDGRLVVVLKDEQA